jgi:hypothetical protein
VAFVIAGGQQTTRLAALSSVAAYERWWNEAGETDREELFHPKRMRTWFDSVFHAEDTRTVRDAKTFEAALTRMPTGDVPMSVPVLPIETDTEIHWLDGAGFHLATSVIGDVAELAKLKDLDFVLSVREGVVHGSE